MPIGKMPIILNAAAEAETPITLDRDNDRPAIIGYGPVMIAAAGYPTRFEREFKRPNFVVRDGDENPNGPAFKRDLADYGTALVPWARIIVGPQVLIKTERGSREVTFVTGDDWEGIEGYGATFRITSIVISSDQTAQEAMNALFRCIWQELEREGDRAFGAAGFSDQISLSLMEGQDIGFAEAFEEDERERRTSAFVDAMRTSLHGGLIAAPSYHGEVFANAIEGKLGRMLLNHRNGLA